MPRSPHEDTKTTPVASSDSCTITKGALDAILAHAAREQPGECCGVLLGQRLDIVDAVPVRNAADSPNRFVLDPKGHIDARRAARHRGLVVVGFYHSHPRSAPVPSATDLAEAFDHESLQLIVGRTGAAMEGRVFRFDRGVAVEIPLAIAGEAPPRMRG